MLFLNGTIEDMSFYQAPSSDRLENLSTFDPGVGWILSVMVHAEPAEPVRGTTYAVVRLFDSKANTHTVELVASYVTGAHHSAWPDGIFEGPTDGNGLIRIVTGTDPAVGNALFEFPPENTRWKLKGMRFSYTTSALGVARLVRITFNAGTGAFQTSPANGTQAPGTIRTYFLAWWGEAPTAGITDIFLMIPPETILDEFYIIASSVESGLSGDDFNAPLLYVEEWLDI